MTMIRLASRLSRFSAAAERYRHGTGTDLVGAASGVAVMAARRPVSPGRRLPLGRRLPSGWRALATLTVAVAALIGCSSAPAAISWRSCPPASAAAQAGFSCATVRVPLQYQHPGGPTIKLAVVRHAAAGPAHRGVIFMNPGGPGYRGTVLIPVFLWLIPGALRRDYDIVSWDPRGVGASTAVQCFPNSHAEAAFLGDYANFPATPGQQAGYIDRWARFGKICKGKDVALIRHLSTADTARDLNLLRRKLGQPKLDYIGVSYGTYLGATYANLFPRQVGKMVLDGNVAPTAWTNGGHRPARRSFLMRLGSTTGVAKTLAAFLSICGQRSTQECAFTAGSPAKTTAKWDALLARLRKGPIAGVTYTTVVSLVVDTLFFVQPFASPVAGASNPGWFGAAMKLQGLWDARNTPASTRPAPSPAATVRRYAGPEQQLAITCGDTPTPPASAFPGLQRLVLRQGGVISLPDLWGDEQCSTWPVRELDTYHGPWNAPTRHILVIGNTTDPSTPLHNAIAMARELSNGRLLVVHQYGHTELLNPDNCASRYETRYFLTGALPPAGTVCQQKLRPFATP
jgi:pimeloyl-ACP methyl ester carboxylesterase